MTSAPRASAVSRPIFLKSARGDTESSKRQDHGANTDVRLRAFAADKNRGTDVSLESNLSKRRVRIIALKETTRCARCPVR
jgi:hypothetical protein